VRPELRRRAAHRFKGVRRAAPGKVDAHLSDGLVRDVNGVGCRQVP
jgi:hypothetical protein